MRAACGMGREGRRRNSAGWIREQSGDGVQVKETGEKSCPRAISHTPRRTRRMRMR